MNINIYIRQSTFIPKDKMILVCGGGWKSSTSKVPFYGLNQLRERFPPILLAADALVFYMAAAGSPLL